MPASVGELAAAKRASAVLGALVRAVVCAAEPVAIKPATTSADTVIGPDIRIGTTNPLVVVERPDSRGAATDNVIQVTCRSAPCYR